jgi:tight adherence protein B
VSIVSIVVVFFVLATVILISVGLGFRFVETQRKKQVQGVIQAAAGPMAESAGTSILLTQAQESPFEGLLKNSGFMRLVGQYITQAGLEWSVEGLLLATGIGAIAGALIGYKLRPLGFVSISVVSLAIVLGGAPYFYLRHRKNKRLEEFEEQLPEALEFLARSMRAGHAFSISLEMLGAESPDPLGQEFRVLFNEQNLGAPIDTALHNFAGRVPLIDVRMFVSSVLLQKQTGGNLSEILARLAYLIRERFRLRGQVKAASAHGRMTAGVLMALPVFLLLGLLFVAPGYVESMANDSDGRWMIIGAIGAQILAFFVIRRITRMKI